MNHKIPLPDCSCNKAPENHLGTRFGGASDTYVSPHIGYHQYVSDVQRHRCSRDRLTGSRIRTRRSRHSNSHMLPLPAVALRRYSSFAIHEPDRGVVFDIRPPSSDCTRERRFYLCGFATVQPPSSPSRDGVRDTSFDSLVPSHRMSLTQYSMTSDGALVAP